MGNGIDPLHVIDQYGADALRLTLMTGNKPGTDMRFYWERIEASKNFANKVWNASRFILMNLDAAEVSENVNLARLTLADKWILHKVNTLAAEVTENMEKFELGIAVQKIYDFIWEEFCNWYIEMVKPCLYRKTEDTQTVVLWTLKTVLNHVLKMLHPFMPFITEEIFCTLNPNEESIMIAPWPKYCLNWEFYQAAADVELMKAAVCGIRAVRSELNVPLSKKIRIYVVSGNRAIFQTFEHGRIFFATLAKASEVYIQADKSGIGDDVMSVMIPGANIYIPFVKLVDLDKEVKRLIKEKERLEKELARSNKILGNKYFISKAPSDKVQEEKKKLNKYTQMMQQVKLRLEQLKNKM